jgi:hypothetical protein
MTTSIRSEATRSVVVVNGVDELILNSGGAVTNGAGEAFGLPIVAGAAPQYACRAWANFIGSTTPPTINASGNIASVERVSTGVFKFTFIVPMAGDNSYTVSADNGADTLSPKTQTTAYNTGDFTVRFISGDTSSLANPTIASVAVFG